MIEQKKFLYKPDKVSPPGDTLADIIEERGMTQIELAERTGRPTKTINEIIRGKAAITPETAILFERVFGTPAEFWNQREANYRAYRARRREAETLKTQKNWLKQFPIREMKNRGWIPDCGPSVTELMICVLNFFGVASPEQWEAGWTKRRLAFRKAMNLSSDVGATTVWLRQGEIEGERIECKPFDRELLIASLSKIRALTTERDPAICIPELRKICAECGVAVVLVKPFPKVPVYGASCWLNPEKALIQLSVRGKTADNLWFTIFHELGHILYHSKKELFVEIKGKRSEQSREEHEADSFSAETLIPKRQLDQWLSESHEINPKTVIEFSSEIGVAPGILVGRLQHDRKIPFSSLNDLKFWYEQ